MYIYGFEVRGCVCYKIRMFFGLPTSSCANSLWFIYFNNEFSMLIIVLAMGKFYNISSSGVTQVSHVHAHCLLIHCVKHSNSPSLISPYHVINHRKSCDIISKKFCNVIVYETVSFPPYHHLNQGIGKSWLGYYLGCFPLSSLIALAHSCIVSFSLLNIPPLDSIPF